MKAKDYTDYLIGATPKSTRGKLLTFLLGSQRAAAFYDARQAMPEAAAQDLPPL